VRCAAMLIWSTVTDNLCIFLDLSTFLNPWRKFKIFSVGGVSGVNNFKCVCSGFLCRVCGLITYDKGVTVTTAWRVLRLHTEDQSPIWRVAVIYWIGSCGHLMRGGPPTLGLGEVLTTAHRCVATIGLLPVLICIS
jgi:hypothetical protein